MPVRPPPVANSTPLPQMREQGALVSQDLIVTAVELGRISHRKIHAQQIGQGPALEPLALQAPLAGGGQQPVDGQDRQDLIPAGALAAGLQMGAPELVQPQLAPQV